MAAPTQTIGTSVLSHQAVAQGATVVSSAINVATKIRGSLFLFHALVEQTANTNPQKWIIQTSGETSGDEDWITIQEIPISFTGTPGGEVLTATEPIGETVIAVAATTGFVQGAELYVENDVLASGEWATVDGIVGNTSVDLLSGLTNEQTAAASFLFSDAQKDIVTLDLTTHNRIRVIYQNEGATAVNAQIKATLTTWDTFV